MTIIDRETHIFKRVNEHYKEIKNKFEVVGIFLQGSQNYGLDVYGDDYKSDIDTKAIILPSFEDIVYNRAPTSTTIVLNNNEHIDVKDIRIMLDTFKKQNINFMEILFTKYKIINPKYKDLIAPLFSNAQTIARLDFNKALDCQCGMSQQKLVALKHPYPTIKEKIDKYGYDPKQLHHILRMNDFIKKYVAGLPYSCCLVPDNKEWLIQIKKGILPVEEAEKLANEVNLETYQIAKQHKSIHNEIDTSAIKILDDVKFTLLKSYFKEQLKKEDDKNESKHHINKIFFTADTHFFHKGIIEFEHRPFKNVDDMNKQLIKNWNDVVEANDLVYILGDFSFGSVKDTEQILKELNGYKILVLGNHDIFAQSNRFDKSLFLKICYCEEISYGSSTTLVMCHYPFASNDGNKYQLYGHIHSNNGYGKHIVKSELPKNSYNVGVDVNNYKPVCIDEVIKILKEKTK